MTRISSKLTYWHKRIFPFVWFGTLAAFVAIAIAEGTVPRDPMFIVMPCVMAVIGYVIMRKFTWDLVDEVYDAGDALVVRNRGSECRVELANVMNVNATTHVNPARIVLRLREPCHFGSEIAFLPVYRFSLRLFARNPVAEDLIVRVDRARLGRVARA